METLERINENSETIPAGPGAEGVRGAVYAAEDVGAVAVDHYFGQSAQELMKRGRDIVRDGLGVPARRLAVALSATSPRADYRAVGFPLQSLTRNAALQTSRALTIVVSLFWTTIAIAQQSSFNLRDTSVEVGETRVLPGLSYQTDRLGGLPIDSLSEAMVNAIADFLKTNPTITMEVGCHCDERASTDKSLQLTQRRCELVKELLEKLGVHGKRIVAQGYGESELIVDSEYIRWLHNIEAKEAAHQTNNRIVLVIVSK